ncbi:MAG: threonine/serine exporter family protein [Lachnospiraceae bacterium]|nr:threonine/serine exporter family protein [Lachnospiraceae bacterium]
MKNEKLNEKLLIETAALAGEIMLISGAEINRVEMTIQHILNLADGKQGENIVLSTGIYISLDDPEGDTITIVRRVAERSTNLNRIYMVNNVSRELCTGKLSVSEAYSQLSDIKKTELYRPFTKYLGYVGTCCFFSLLFAGSLWDCFAAALVGIGLAAVMALSKRIRFNDFCTETIAAFFIGLAVLCLKDFIMPNIRRDTVIVSAIMPLVPGVVFTTAIRDTLNGDYSAGAARMLEAITTALAVAAGVGASMGLFQFFMGGEYRW